jgi:Mg-chelatase subunit ChlD
MSNGWEKFRPQVPVPLARDKVEASERAEGPPAKPVLVKRLEDKYRPQPGGTAFVVLDCSSSMADSQKLRRAKMGAVEFAESAVQKGYEVGLIQFADFASVVVAPTVEAKKIRPAVEELSANGSTNLAGALQLAREVLRQVKRVRAVVVVSDGEPNDKQLALEIGRELKKDGVEIITVGTDDADRHFLARLATRADLATIVLAENLQQAIARTAAALALPKPKGK